MSKTGTKSKKSTESAALSVSGPQPVWMTLNEARERAFTGEVVFEVESEVLAYLDNGVVYYAERADDVSLGRRLLDSGVIDASQLERGTVRVGDVEHLGRLFDRDSSVDRDAVLVVAETATEELIADLANRAISTIRVTAYRHHPSGVHRWFVAPVEPAVNPRPIGEVAQLDTTVVDDLPGLPVASASDPAGELTIEWDESLDGFEELEPLPAIDEFDASMLEAMLDGGDIEVEIISDTPDDDADDWDQSVEALLDFTIEPDVDDVVQIDPDVVPDAAEAFVESPVEDIPTVEEMSIVEEVAEVAELEDVVFEEILFEAVEVQDVEELVAEEPKADLVVEPETVAEDEESVWESASVDDDVDLEFQVVWPDDSEDHAEVAVSDDLTVNDDATDEPAQAEELALVQESAEVAPVVQTENGGLYFEMPPLTLSDEPTADEEVPDDVADAVRRAIAAIESAAMDSPSIAPISDPGSEGADAPAGAPAEAASALSAFAPPSMDSSAEVLYSQWEEAAAEAASAAKTADVTVEPDPGDAENERSSALRRLIGSLRRKDR